MVKMKKPKARVVKSICYHEMVRYLEAKYKRDFSDYAAHRNGVKCTCQFNGNHQFQWENTHYPRLAEFRKHPIPNYGLSKEGLNFYNTPEGSRWFDEIRKAYDAAPDGKAKELPFWCFWHFMLGIFEISNGVTRSVNWAELATCGEEWQQEICKLFVKEFGKKDMKVQFCW